MAEPNSDEQNTTSYITFLGEKLNWPLTLNRTWQGRTGTQNLPGQFPTFTLPVLP